MDKEQISVVELECGEDVLNWKEKKMGERGFGYLAVLEHIIYEAASPRGNRCL